VPLAVVEYYCLFLQFLNDGAVYADYLWSNYFGELRIVLTKTRLCLY
jgi:hypothetical protein